jgi:cytochrome c5
MRWGWVGLTLAAASILTGCESTPSAPAPPVTAAMVQSGARQHYDAASLTTGRSLFVGRCARCHALPAVGGQGTEDWPGIMAEMAKRSGLKPDQTKVVLAYILAAQASERR